MHAVEDVTDQNLPNSVVVAVEAAAAVIVVAVIVVAVVDSLLKTLTYAQSNTVYKDVR